MSTPNEDLIARLADHPERVLLIVGSGVSIASTRRAPAASWKGLLEHGVQYCTDHLHLDGNWTRIRGEQLEHGELIEVASEISKRLDAPESGRYAGWLQETVGSLTVSEPRLIRAIRQLGAQIATTNYDTLISQQTGLEPITWQDDEWLAQFVQAESRKVLHLHGVFQRANTVVMGARSYEDVVRNRPIQDVMKALVISKSLVFIGCGFDGLNDPNIGGLLRWYREVVKGMVCSSYLLSSDPEIADWRRKLEGSQIELISYGSAYDDLPVFLEKFSEEVRRRRAPARPLDDLILAQPTFDQKVREVLASKEAIGPVDMLRQLMQHAREHWLAGGKRSAWLMAAGILTQDGKTLMAEERVRFGLELAEMMVGDGMLDHAFHTLRELLQDVQTGEIRPDQRHEYWDLQSRCLQEIGPFAGRRSRPDVGLHGLSSVHTGDQAA